jgi:hypothetical protein
MDLDPKASATTGFGACKEVMDVSRGEADIGFSVADAR